MQQRTTRVQQRTTRVQQRTTRVQHETLRLTMPRAPDLSIESAVGRVSHTFAAVARRPLRAEQSCKARPPRAFIPRCLGAATRSLRAPHACLFVCFGFRPRDAPPHARRGMRRNRRAGRDARADPLVLSPHAAAAQRVLRRGLRLFHLQLCAAARVGHDGTGAVAGATFRAGTRLTSAPGPAPHLRRPPTSARTTSSC